MLIELMIIMAIIGINGCKQRERGEMTQLIPREVLFGNPEREGLRLSPDGTRLAYCAPDDGVMNVWVKTIGSDDDYVLTRNRHRGVSDFFWSFSGKRILYFQDRDGDENWHLYSVPVGGGEERDLTPFENVQVRVIAQEADFPDEILIGLNRRDPQLHDVYRLDLRTGALDLVQENGFGAADWICDHTFTVRCAMISTESGGGRLLHRKDGNDEWSELLSWNSEDNLTTQALSFDADNRRLRLFSSINSNTAEFRVFDTDNNLEKTVVSDPDVDLGPILLTHPTGHNVQAVSVISDRWRWKILDPDIEKDFEKLRSLHVGDFRVLSRDLADKKWVVAYTQDNGPAIYYLYRREEKLGEFLFSQQPKLEGLPLAEMKPITYAARDGLAINGYLTLPMNAKTEKLPTVINVHGGPWYRDIWRFHPEVQWLANRGYAVLQINFRGSTGYGKDFINAGDREWGGKMQDDVSDAVAWLIGQGIADPERIAIYGGSYGGFAVLSGMTKTPELYACGVAIVGPSNLITWAQSIPPYWEPIKAMIYRRVGHPVHDAEFLKSRSPLFHIDRIDAPLLIAQGANDPRVRREESLQIVEALKKGEKAVEYVEFADEGHGFRKPENRIAFYSKAEKFLAQHLGGRYED